MSLRFRIGPFTFGRSGIRFSLWRKSTGISIPLTNRKKSGTFGKVKFGIFSYFFNNKTKRQKQKRHIPIDKVNIKKNHLNAYEPWTSALDEELIYLFRKGNSVKDLSQTFGRTTGAIRSRINKLLLD